MLSEHKNILIVTNIKLHQKNGAAFSRIQCYKKAMGHSYSFYSLEMDQFFTSNTNFRFNQCKISSIEFLSVDERIENYLYRNFIRIFDIIRPIRLIHFIKKNFHKENTKVLLYSHHFLLTIITILLLKFRYGYNVIIEKNELETGIQLNIQVPKNFAIFPFLLLFPIRLIFAVFNDLSSFLGSGIIVISTNLQKIYKHHLALIRIPIIVDVERFNTNNNDNKFSKTCLPKFVYLGTFTRKKDAIFKIFGAISELEREFPGTAEFFFIGNGTSAIKSDMESYIEKNALHEIVKIEYDIPYSIVPEELCKYDIAFLIRDRNLQTKFGFSTKLGEYLAAGLPVITNDISDNTLYLSDGFNSFFLKKVSVNELKLKILKICKSGADLTAMRVSAKFTAQKWFSYKNYRCKLLKMLG